MNPYSPPIALAKGSDALHATPPTLLHRVLFATIAMLIVASTGAFSFFASLPALGVGVNWPNVIPLLLALLCVSLTLWAFRMSLLHVTFAQRIVTRYTFGLGCLVGLIAAALARLGLI